MKKLILALAISTTLFSCTKTPNNLLTPVNNNNTTGNFTCTVTKKMYIATVWAADGVHRWDSVNCNSTEKIYTNITSDAAFAECNSNDTTWIENYYPSASWKTVIVGTIN